MTPTIHFIRHAQGYHNLNVANHQIRDPMLTPHGEAQCALLNKTFPYIVQVELVVASPLKRTIYTALKSFPDVIAKRKLQVIALPELQETSDLPCDTGSSLEDLKKEFANQPVSFDILTPDYNSKKGRWAPEAAALEERARVAREWLKARPKKHIVAVTHGGVLHYITQDWRGADKFQAFAVRHAEHYETRHPDGYVSGKMEGFVDRTGWYNAEFRSYNFTNAAAATLLETEDSKQRRLKPK